MLTKIHTQNDDHPFDDRGILKDGRSVSVGLLMRRGSRRRGGDRWAQRGLCTEDY
jgi:hypothetical protein